MNDIATTVTQARADAARRADAVPGFAVAFPNNVVLELPRARMSWRRGEDRSRVVQVFRFQGDLFTPETRAAALAHAADVARLDAATRDVDALGAAMDLGARVIPRNYQFTDEEITELLVYVEGDPESLERFKKLTRLARGFEPEPPAAEATTDGAEADPARQPELEPALAAAGA